MFRHLPFLLIIRYIIYNIFVHTKHIIIYLADRRPAVTFDGFQDKDLKVNLEIKINVLFTFDMQSAVL